MTNLVFFLEELSAKEMLDGLLPRVLPDGIHHTCMVFRGKLETLTKQKYEKVAGSRKIAQHLRIDGNKSVSFNRLIDGIRKLLGESSIGC